MPAAKVDIEIPQGGKFIFSVQAKSGSPPLPMDLSGFSGRMQIRPTIESTTILVDATTANGMISINGPVGIATVIIGGDVTAAYTWTTGHYDLEVFNSASNVFRIAQGFASLSKEVTR